MVDFNAGPDVAAEAPVALAVEQRAAPQLRQRLVDAAPDELLPERVVHALRAVGVRGSAAPQERRDGRAVAERAEHGVAGVDEPRRDGGQRLEERRELDAVAGAELGAEEAQGDEGVEGRVARRQRRQRDDLGVLAQVGRHDLLVVAGGEGGHVVRLAGLLVRCGHAGWGSFGGSAGSGSALKRVAVTDLGRSC